MAVTSPAYFISMMLFSAETLGESQELRVSSGVQLPSSWLATTLSWLGSTRHWASARAGTRQTDRSSRNIVS